jgi:hypothetical protein
LRSRKRRPRRPMRSCTKRMGPGDVHATASAAAASTGEAATMPKRASVTSNTRGRPHRGAAPPAQLFVITAPRERSYRDSAKAHAELADNLNHMIELRSAVPEICDPIPVPGGGSSLLNRSRTFSGSGAQPLPSPGVSEASSSQWRRIPAALSEENRAGLAASLPGRSSVVTRTNSCF